VGWSCHWFLVRDGEPDAVAERLGGRLEGQPVNEETATTRDAPGPTVGPAINGWRMVTDVGWQLLDDDTVVRLSMGAHVLEVAVEEHVSFASAASWRNGRREWSLTFDPVHGPARAIPTGEVPAPDEGEYDDALDGDGDGFEEPIDLVHRLTGWRYDAAYPELENGPFVPLVGLPRPARRWRPKRWWAPWRTKE